jgi:hypothetical protein
LRLLADEKIATIRNSSKNEKNNLLPTLLLLSCYDAERNCKDFKTGKFKFDYEVEGVKKTTLLSATTALKLKL